MTERLPNGLTSEQDAAFEALAISLARHYGVEEHAFQPGDGEMHRTDECQFPGCGGYLSEHEEGEPCCYPFFSTAGQQHAFNCSGPGA